MNASASVVDFASVQSDSRSGGYSYEFAELPDEYATDVRFEAI